MGQLIGTNTGPAVGQEPDRGEPLLQRDGAVLENGPDLYGELLFALKALPNHAGCKKRQSLGATARAFRTTGPFRFRDQFQRSFGIRKITNGNRQAFGKFGFKSLHW